MADTYTLISSVTVGAGGASSIDFTSIPATYTDLLVKWSLRGSTNTTYMTIQLNGSTSSRTSLLLFGTGSGTVNTTTTTLQSGGGQNASSYTANTFSNGELYLPNYAGSVNKSMSIDSVSENNASNADAGLTAALWSNTSAINRVTLYEGSSGTFAQYSTAYLYGIKNS